VALCALWQVLDAFAAKRRAVREAAGALELESAEFRFETGGDDDGAPTAMALKADIPMMKVRSLTAIYGFPRSALHSSARSKAATMASEPLKTARKTAPRRQRAERWRRMPPRPVAVQDGFWLVRASALKGGNAL
jgi:hypothetical protein